MTLHSLQSNTTPTYIGDSHRKGSFKIGIVAKNLQKLIIALEIIERHGLAEEYKKEIGSALPEHTPEVTKHEQENREII